MQLFALLPYFSNSSALTRRRQFRSLAGGALSELETSYSDQIGLMIPATSIWVIRASAFKQHLNHRNAVYECPCIDSWCYLYILYFCKTHTIPYNG